MTSQICQLWMGALESYMTESFIMTAFTKMGESPTSIKIMRNKLTGEEAGYCFVHFKTDEMAKTAMHKLNGKIVPGSSPPVRFKLNHAGSNIKHPIIGQDREYSLWVGDLSPDVDDYTLYKCFASRYQSIRTAKVVLDSAGFSKGYAFVRFASEEEQKSCSVQMNGFKGLGSRPIKISSAIPKSKKSDGAPISTLSGQYEVSTTQQQYYNPSMWQNYSAWQQGYYDVNQEQSAVHQVDYTQHPTGPGDPNYDLELVEHDVNIDVQQLNQELLNRDCDFWDALESSKWMPVES